MPKRWKQIATDLGALIGSTISDSERPEVDGGEGLANDAVKLLDFKNWLDQTDAVEDGVKAKVWEMLDDAERIDSDPGKQLDFLYEVVNQEAADDFSETGYDMSTVDERSVPLNPVIPADAEASGAGSPAADTTGSLTVDTETTPPPTEATASPPDETAAVRSDTGVSPPPATEAAPPPPGEAAAPPPHETGTPQGTAASAGPPPPESSAAPPAEAPPSDVPPEPQPH